MRPIESLSQFTPAQSRTRRWPWFLLWAVALSGTALTVRAVTRSPAAGKTTAGHVHGAAVAVDSTRPVVLGPEDRRLIGVTYAVVALEPLQRQVRVVGQVTLDETRVASISPRVDGWVEALFVNTTGQPVRAGEPLYALYSPMLVSAEEEYLLARRLAATMGGGDSTRGPGDLADAARRRLLQWEVPREELRRLEESGVASRAIRFTAPRSGVVLEKTVLQGQRIMAGETIYKVADLGTVWLEGEVFEQDLPAVLPGQRVTAEFQALPGDQRTARIAYVYPTLNPETRTARIRVSLANPGLTLKPGMFATIRFEAPAGRPVLSVPRSAVLATGERNLVFVKHGAGRFTPVQITPGAATDDRIEVLRGLAAGDTVVASATFLMDAESNLGTLLGGMGDMPGMDMSAPSAATDSTHRGHGD